MLAHIFLVLLFRSAMVAEFSQWRPSPLCELVLFQKEKIRVLVDVQLRQQHLLRLEIEKHEKGD